MKKSLLASTLIAAVALAAPAFSAELIDSWDFTSMEEGATGDIIGSSGKLTLSTGDLVNGSGELAITNSSSTKTTIDLTDQNISVTEGISIVITIDSWNFTGANSDHYILASIAKEGQDNYAATGMTGSIGTGEGEGTLWGAANGSDVGMSTTSGTLTFTGDTATTITITFIGNTVSLYQDGELIGTGTISSYSDDATVTGAAIGSWDSTSTGNEPNLNISNLEIWKGDVMEGENLVWAGTDESYTWDTTTANWSLGDDPSTYKANDNVTFGTDGYKIVDITRNVTPGPSQSKTITRLRRASMVA